MIFSISCFATKKAKYDIVYKLHDYGNPRSLKQSKKQFYFRYSIANEEIDIWSDDSIHYFGKLFCYTARRDKRKIKYYGINVHISDSITNEIVKCINNFHILEIFSKDSIVFPLTDCSDCDIAEYEYSNGKHYIQKRYFSIKASQTIDSFENFIKKGAEMDKYFYEFIDRLPNGLYQKNMVDVIKS
jgi:hypothetical protein